MAIMKDKKLETLETWEEIEKKEIQWEKDHPILYAIKRKMAWFLSHFWYRIPDYPRDIKLWIKEKYQRATRGWADSDTWGFDYYLIDVMYNGLKHFKVNLHGYPAYMTFEEWKKNNR